ncbi:MAG: beta-galactosidase, partial [Chloroflexota bacterium]
MDLTPDHAPASAARAEGNTPRLVAAYGLYYLDNQPVLLRAADVPYFCVPPEQWAGNIERLRSAGCNAITSAIPWGWHEPVAGEVDFDGRTHAQRDLLGFLGAVQR